jgi:DNA-binding NtrC family response regulator
MRVLIVGSLAGELGRAAALARGRGAQVSQADDVRAALAVLRREAAQDLVLCDIACGIGPLVRSLAAERIAVAVVACSMSTQPDVAAQAIRDGAREFLALPPDPDLISAILLAASGEPHAPVVRDAAMLAMLRRAEQVARSDASVLITGESGTGKEVVARYIHRHSRRSVGPFVALNCAAIPEQLLESEMFGHEKGAFSGAVARRCGKFEAASGGTLLLDEISEMDVRLQAKLLRALQEREIDRLGGSQPVRIDVRILATSNRDLRAEIEARRFREDLYFRLNVVSLHLPPLRERPSDIPVLAAHYAQHYAEVNGLPARTLSTAALARLTGQAWRGNVRELENVVHRAVLLAGGSEIGPDAIDLPAPPSVPAAMRQRAAGGFVGRRVDEVERDLILETLSHTLGNRTHAAIILGISIRALRNKLRDYMQAGIEVPPPAAPTLAAPQMLLQQAAGADAGTIAA